MRHSRTRYPPRTSLTHVLLLVVLASAGACTNGGLFEGAGCVVGPCGPPAGGDYSGILPNTASLARGDSIQFTVFTSRQLVWSVTDASIGTVSQSGMFRARGVGATTVVAIDTAQANYSRSATVSVHFP